ncbi:MAG TPA: response regulator [Spirochaetes bacterium]|nr:response regulator [Spirochaetota bacterium]
MDRPGIMIVEDEALVARDLGEVLEKLGYHVVGTAYTGEDALLKVRAAPPDLVLMDIMLGGGHRRDRYRSRDQGQPGHTGCFPNRPFQRRHRRTGPAYQPLRLHFKTFQPPGTPDSINHGPQPDIPGKRADGLPQKPGRTERTLPPAGGICQRHDHSHRPPGRH